MRIVKGRGNSRQILLDIPDSSVVRRSSRAEQRQVTELVCSFAGIEVTKTAAIAAIVGEAA